MGLMSYPLAIIFVYTKFVYFDCNKSVIIIIIIIIIIIMLEYRNIEF